VTVRRGFLPLDFELEGEVFASVGSFLALLLFLTGESWDGSMARFVEPTWENDSDKGGSDRPVALGQRLVGERWGETAATVVEAEAASPRRPRRRRATTTAPDSEAVSDSVHVPSIKERLASFDFLGD
jgi:hypothetical protein